jgi:hypothetical protein
MLVLVKRDSKGPTCQLGFHTPLGSLSDGRVQKKTHRSIRILVQLGAVYVGIVVPRTFVATHSNAASLYNLVIILHVEQSVTRELPF